MSRAFGPKQADHPSVGNPCPACHVPFAAGAWTTLVMLGPGDSEDARERCLAGRAYNAVAVEAHYACVHGEEPVESSGSSSGGTT